LRLFRHLGCALLGAAVSLGALSVHRAVVPLGVVLALAVSFAVPWWLLRSDHRTTAASYVAGWLVVLGVAVVGRPEGDYVIANDLRGWSLLAAGPVMVLVGIVSVAGGRDLDT
jgi:hypothetical protein